METFIVYFDPPLFSREQSCKITYLLKCRCVSFVAVKSIDGFILSPPLLCFLVSSSDIEASPDTNATLPCSVALSATGSDSVQSGITVRWVKNGSEIASFGEGVTQIKAGFSWDPADFVNGDFSLVILKASFDLQGVYECTASHNVTILHSSKVTLSLLGMSPFCSCGFICSLITHLNLKSLVSSCPPPSLSHPVDSSAVGGVGNEHPAQMPRGWFLPSSCVLLVD